MDKLQHSKLLTHLSGQIFLTHYQAVTELATASSEYQI
jgi:hypothetical protein